jgi:hypothetical protein
VNEPEPWSTTQAPRLPVLRHVRGLIRGRVETGWHEATAELDFLLAPREELADLGLSSPLRASAGWVGISIEGAEEA